MLDSQNEKKNSISQAASYSTKSSTPDKFQGRSYQKQMDFLLELSVEDMDIKSSSSSSPPALAHQVSMCSYLPNDSVSSLQLTDLEDMDLTGGGGSSGSSPDQREMVVNNGGGMWSAHNKRSSITEQQGSFSQQPYFRGNGRQQGQIKSHANHERPVKKQRVVSKNR